MLNPETNTRGKTDEENRNCCVRILLWVHGRASSESEFACPMACIRLEERTVHFGYMSMVIYGGAMRTNKIRCAQIRCAQIKSHAHTAQMRGNMAPRSSSRHLWARETRYAHGYEFRGGSSDGPNSLKLRRGVSWRSVAGLVGGPLLVGAVRSLAGVSAAGTFLVSATIGALPVNPRILFCMGFASTFAIFSQTRTSGKPGRSVPTVLARAAARPLAACGRTAHGTRQQQRQRQE